MTSGRRLPTTRTVPGSRAASSRMSGQYACQNSGALGILVGYRWYASKGITPLFPVAVGRDLPARRPDHPPWGMSGRPRQGTLRSSATIRGRSR